MFQLSVKLDIRAKDFESKIFFIIFGLFASFLAVQIYIFAYQTLITEPEINAARNIGVFRPLINDSDVGQ